MTDELETFATYARTMAAPGAHLNTCHGTRKVRGRFHPVTVHPDPQCTGCVPQSDRDLWARLADEADAHRTRHEDTALL